MVTSGFSTTTDYAKAVAIQPDGKIVVGGQAKVSNDDFALVRLNSDGTPDATFGTGGKVTTDFGVDNDYINAVMILSDGKILALGSTLFPVTSLRDFALVRYNTDGSLDATFGTGGKLVTDMGPGTNQIDAAALQTDGKLVVAGAINAGPTADFVLARYDLASTPVTPSYVQNHNLPEAISIYPNPAHRSAVVDYTLPVAGTVWAGIADVAGRTLSTVVQQQEQIAGKHTAVITVPDGLSSGMYLLYINAGQQRYSIPLQVVQ